MPFTLTPEERAIVASVVPAQWLDTAEAEVAAAMDGEVTRGSHTAVIAAIAQWAHGDNLHTRLLQYPRYRAVFEPATAPVIRANVILRKRPAKAVVPAAPAVNPMRCRYLRQDERVAAWELAHGKVPEGLRVGQSCAVQYCERLDHMILVEDKTRSFRGWSEYVDAANALAIGESVEFTTEWSASRIGAAIRSAKKIGMKRFEFRTARKGVVRTTRVADYPRIGEEVEEPSTTTVSLETITPDPPAPRIAIETQAVIAPEPAPAHGPKLLAEPKPRERFTKWFESWLPILEGEHVWVLDRDTISRIVDCFSDRLWMGADGVCDRFEDASPEEFVLCQRMARACSAISARLRDEAAEKETAEP